MIEAFRRPDRSLLMPPAGTPLEPETMIDISHESLMRVWEKLKGSDKAPGWLEEEAQAAQTYRRLAETAVLWKANKASLWRDPELQQGLAWRAKNQPNETWAARYHPEFALAMHFLTKSRSRKKRGLWVKVGIAGLAILAAYLAFFSLTQSTLLATTEAALEQAQYLRLIADSARQTADSAALVARFERQVAQEQFRLADSRRLASQAASLLESEFSLALLLSGEAFRTAPTIEAQTALLTALQNKRDAFTTLYGHKANVNSVAFSPDGTRLASSSTDSTIILWDARTGQLLTKLEGHTDAVSSVAFSPDAQRLASANYDGTIRLWDVQTGQPLGEPLQGHTSFVLSVAFSPDGTRLASASNDGAIRLWDVQTGQPLSEPLQGHTSSVTSVAFSPDGQLLASASRDETICLWDMQTGLLLSILRGHTSWVNSVTFSPDGQRLASASNDETIRLCERRNRRGACDAHRTPGCRVDGGLQPRRTAPGLRQRRPDAPSVGSRS